MCRLITCLVFVGLLIIVSVIIHYTLKNWVITYSEIDKCPYCYGKSLCEDIDNDAIKLQSSSLFSIILNIFNTKNVYYGDYKNINVVLKKLGSNDELERLNSLICRMTNHKNGCEISTVSDKSDYAEKIVALLMKTEKNEIKSFKVCSNGAVELFFKSLLSLRGKDVESDVFLKNVWTILQMNVEPLLIQILESTINLYVPKYYGACGRFIVEENRGIPLNHMSDKDWMQRADLAVQLLQAAEAFTFNHRDFRFYLTDISPDNIAVDDNFKVTFVDLEHVFLLDKNNTSTGTFHKSEVIDDVDGFAFSADDLCDNTLSDHNYYSVCKNLLSRDAPSPMMKNGLLHSCPRTVSRKYPELFDLIEKCVDPGHDGDRIGISKEIVKILNAILNEHHSQ